MKRLQILRSRNCRHKFIKNLLSEKRKENMETKQWRFESQLINSLTKSWSSILLSKTSFSTTSSFENTCVLVNTQVFWKLDVVLKVEPTGILSVVLPFYNFHKRTASTGTPHRIHVDSTWIFRRYIEGPNFDESHVISAYFFDVISSMVENPHCFQVLLSV